MILLDLQEVEFYFCGGLLEAFNTKSIHGGIWLQYCKNLGNPESPNYQEVLIDAPRAFYS